MRAMLAVVGIVCAAVGFAVPAPSARADQAVCRVDGGGSVCAFYSPTQKISCEIDYQRGGIGNQAYCQTATQSVTMDPSGMFKTCAGPSCLGNPAMGTPTLAYGRTAATGPFSCLSEPTGVTCTVASGRGFTVSTSGVAPAH